MTPPKPCKFAESNCQGCPYELFKTGKNVWGAHPKKSEKNHAERKEMFEKPNTSGLVLGRPPEPDRFVWLKRLCRSPKGRLLPYSTSGIELNGICEELRKKVLVASSDWASGVLHPK